MFMTMGVHAAGLKSAGGSPVATIRRAQSVYVSFTYRYDKNVICIYEAQYRGF